MPIGPFKVPGAVLVAHLVAQILATPLRPQRTLSVVAELASCGPMEVTRSAEASWADVVADVTVDAGKPRK